MYFTLDSWDHPRVGGEKAALAAVYVSALGSPPRGRGKAASGALAGGVQMDHPRVGGEKLIAAVQLIREFGITPA